MAEHLDVVVGKADNATPDGSHQHKDSVDVVQSRKEQHRHDDGEQDDDTSHCRCTLLLELSVQTEVSDILANLISLKQANNTLTQEHHHQQRQDNRHNRAETQESHNTRTGDVEIGC